jgi:hypothetical protein
MTNYQRSFDAAAVAALRSVNEKTLIGGCDGTTFQVVTSANGDKIPTGTVGAMLVNIKLYDDAFKIDDKLAMAELESRLNAAVPVLKKVGMFDLFKPEEWTRGESEGRKLVGTLATKGQ